jgi:hypothetical protein
VTERETRIVPEPADEAVRRAIGEALAEPGQEPSGWAAAALEEGVAGPDDD